MEIKAVSYVSLSELVPEQFFEQDFLAGCPFSFGDTDHTLVSAGRFHSYCKRDVDPDEIEGYAEWFGKFTDDFLKGRYSGVFIDLES